MEFSQKLEILMKSEKITAYRLAKNIGVHQTSVKNWLDGKYPSTEHLAKIAKHFGTTADRLISDELYETKPDRQKLHEEFLSSENDQKNKPLTERERLIEECNEIMDNLPKDLQEVAMAQLRSLSALSNKKQKK